jgi:hypothetical protein
MKMLDRFARLFDTGQTLKRKVGRPCPHRCLMVLLSRAQEQGGLGVDGAWRLAGSEARALQESAGFTPPGGWRGVAALAAGCGVLEATAHGFEPTMRVAQLAQWSPEKALQRMVEAFTTNLVPPTTAAGLFILVGIHPAWGVHLAHACNRRDRGELDEETFQAAREDMFPDEVLDIVERTVFEALNTIVGALRGLDSEKTYSIDALADVIDAACQRAREEAYEELAELDARRGIRGLAPLVDLPHTEEDANWRVIDFATSDLLDAFLIPAAAARRFDDGRFWVDSEAFEAIDLGRWGADQQRLHLNEALNGSDDCVA